MKCELSTWHHPPSVGADIGDLLLDLQTMCSQQQISFELSWSESDGLWTASTSGPARAADAFAAKNCGTAERALRYLIGFLRARFETP